MNKQELINERKKKFKKLGIPSPISENSIVGHGGTSRAAKLQAIKNGSKRGDMNKISTKGKGASGFEGIPEPKMKKNPNDPRNKVSPGKSVAVEEFGSSRGMDAETSAILSMFDSRKGSKRSSAASSGTLDYDSGPSFNPAAALKRKVEEASRNRAEDYNHEEYEESQYLKHSNAYKTHAFDMENMMTIMEDIARKTISEVLDSYTKKQQVKKKLSENTFEKINTKDGSNVIKIDGEYYKLTPAKPKKKS